MSTSEIIRAAERRVLYSRSIEICTAFCRRNGIAAADYNVEHIRFGACGFYQRSEIVVDLRKCADIAHSPSPRRCSYPGFKTDRTPFGVVAHETGHHVSAMIGRPRGWTALCRETDQITSYEPNVEEAFAETCRLFILNPDMLRVGWPTRYAALVSHGVASVETRSWREILADSEKHVQMFAQWVGRRDPQQILL